jgi:hypothetical protein
MFETVPVMLETVPVAVEVVGEEGSHGKVEKAEAEAWLAPQTTEVEVVTDEARARRQTRRWSSHTASWLAPIVAAPASCLRVPVLPPPEQ